MSADKATAQAQGHTHDHDHGHDHGNVQAKPLRPAQNPQGSIFFRLVNGLLHQSSKAYVHTRYSTVGNTVALEYMDTADMVAGKYNGQRTYLGQLLLSFVGIVFSWRDWLLSIVLGLNDFLVLLAVFVLDQIFASSWCVFRRLPLRSLMVYGSLVFGTRCFWAIFSSHKWPGAAVAFVVYGLWASFVGGSYLDHPRDWNFSCWPKTPRAIVHSSLSWYKPAVFWNIVGIFATVGAQIANVTEPLFPEVSA
ncbi:hypothetical protein PG994_005574 [Apiospora phragmitis]|uniref:Uncharacterized protein n=1 Tax=Apiospora phragmitis TaxID=2905665 RepID=A0ABR1VGE7_9PEZI